MKEKIHFSGLDGLRFISISFVVLHHLFTFKNYYGFSAIQFPKIGLIGYYGIQFFFAGSGFLITYLLLAEYQQYNRISLKNFFLRRVLRIWPAYYLLIVTALIFCIHISYFDIPVVTKEYLAGDYKKANQLYLFFLPHIASNYTTTAPYVHQTYTIGIEEQFYFLWGSIFLLAPKKAKYIFLFFLLCMPLLKIVYNIFYNPEIHTINTIKGIFFKIIFYMKYSRISTFSIGALLAFLYFFKRSYLFFFKNKKVQLLVYLLMATSIYFDISIPFFRDEYITILTLAVFMIATFKNESIINYSSGWISYLGKISYGIYLFHVFAIVLSINICKNIFHFKMDGYFELIVLSLLTIVLSILFGWISYNFFEIYFLKLKKRFSKL